MAIDGKVLPLVEVACAVCGGEEMETLCTVGETAAQSAYLVRFHKRRLKPEASPAALEERACFTQSYPTLIVRCRACGLVLRDPRPTDQDIARLYEHDSYDRERLEAIFASQLALYRPTARLLARWLRAGAKVVEVGSFAGGFLIAGREQGWEMLGVDPGEEVADFARDKGFHVFQGTLDHASLCPRSVDAVAVWNTLDQLPDPLPTLLAASRLLRPDGILAIRVPNGEFFAGACRLLRHTRHSPLANWILDAMAWNNMLGFPYLYGYSKSTLDRLVSRYGFTRCFTQVDTLVSLADRQTRPWARQEERVIKALQRGIARAQMAWPGAALSLAPWLDLIYVKANRLTPA